MINKTLHNYYTIKNIKFNTFFAIAFVLLLFIRCSGQNSHIKNKTFANVKVITIPATIKPIIVGAANTAQYLPLLKNKTVGIVANQTSMINKTHLVDSLISLKINVKKVFSPEHGFRGIADAGEKIKSNFDKKTGLKIISLYGKNKKPTPEELKGLNVIIFDIQDVGARFYTYISTLHYVMEACAENKVDLIILDRPNPNGYYVDGPILEKKFKSFIGLDPIPIVHGMTIGEYAKMINNEGWLKNKEHCKLTVIKCKNYTHLTLYKLPIKPSPNLPNMGAIYLYPSLCLFEGTPISVGRGTNKPFQIIGHPKIKSDEYSFTPKSMRGAKHPKLLNQKCYGYNLSTYGKTYMKDKGSINLFWLINIYNKFPDKAHFFNKTFNLLAGTNQLQQQIKEGKTAKEIKASWQAGLTKFKKIRIKYLLYKDFE